MRPELEPVFEHGLHHQLYLLVGRPIWDTRVDVVRLPGFGESLIPVYLVPRGDIVRIILQSPDPCVVHCKELPRAARPKIRGADVRVLFDRCHFKLRPLREGDPVWSERGCGCKTGQRNHGEVVLVTDRDQVVAELVPPGSARSSSAADALLAESVRNGWVTPATLPQSGIPLRMPVTKFKTLMRELDRDRSDR
jgi:hypothetical protein